MSLEHDVRVFQTNHCETRKPGLLLSSRSPEVEHDHMQAIGAYEFEKNSNCMYRRLTRHKCLSQITEEIIEIERLG